MVHIFVIITLLYFVDQVYSTGIYDEDDGSSLQGRTDDDRHALWCYEQNHCKETSPHSAWHQGPCKAGTRQSPINIISSQAKKFGIASTTGPKLPLPLTLHPVSSTRPVYTINFSNISKNYVMKEFQLFNNGHTTVLRQFVTETGTDSSFKWESRGNGVYKLQQVHFHWGPDDSKGSEHKIDGKAFPVEMHMVHYRSKDGENGYSSILEAGLSGKTDAFAVIGVFLEAGDNLTTSFLEPVVSNFDKISNRNDKFTVNLKLNLGQHLENVNEAFHYMGSLTTPACNEVVAWLVLPNPVKISPKDLIAFRGAVKEGSAIPLLNNYRSVQDNKEQLARLNID